MVANNAPFITFEGGEGAGKTTQIALLKDYLEKTGKKTVVLTREPGGTQGAESIRDLIVKGKESRWDAETDTLLFMAARRDNLVKNIWPAMERGEWVLCDRFCDSTYAYQCFGRGLELERAKSVYKFIAGDFKPDLTFVLDIDPKIGLERAFKGKGRNLEENRFENFDFSFHEALRNAYHTMAAAEPDRFEIIDANRPLEEIQDNLRKVIHKRFGV